MLIRDLFVHDVTRTIPPVVYFHEHSPEKLKAEVSEYIVTGGWPEGHPNHRRVPDGIHEQYVRLLTEVANTLENDTPELPTVWISGFYGSGKSSFAKLLAYALDGASLEGGQSLAEALLRRDTSPRAAELRAAWTRLRHLVDPMISVVFDVGAYARDEHIHAAAVRKLQERLDYCSYPLVADFELKLERDGEWKRFEKIASERLGKPWSEVRTRALAEEDFSLVMSGMFPAKYPSPTDWFAARMGTTARAESPEEAVTAIRDMLEFRRKGATAFFVVDEVSQYVIGNNDRIDRLRAFASALGTKLHGRAWLMALGQQKIDEGAGESLLIWAKDRFPPRLRVHLEPTNIRDVVHKRLLQKKPEAETLLKAQFDAHRADLKLFGYKCEDITAEDFIEVYPMLPGHIDLILQITSALRSRPSSRAQGDDQAIRGLLQLLGELFRARKLAEREIGALVTLDEIYEVQHTALDSDTQASMARIHEQAADDSTGLLLRCAKTVALLELIQESANLPTDARLVARCLFDRLDRGDQFDTVTEALEELRRRNLLGYSEKTGYKIQSSAAEEWERDRRDITAPRESRVGQITKVLTDLLGIPDLPSLPGRSFPWAGRFSDGRRLDDIVLADPREDAVVLVDFRYVAKDERTESTWIKRSDESQLVNRLVWVAGDGEQLDHIAAEMFRSTEMIRRMTPRKDSLNPARKQLLQQEESRLEDLEKAVRAAAQAAWMDGRFYFRGSPYKPSDQGPTFAVALQRMGDRVVGDLFPHHISTVIKPEELMKLVADDLSGPSPKFLTDELGILAVDGGRYVPSCSGVVPRRVAEQIEKEGGLSGTALLAALGGPPYGYTPNVVKACVAGLLRAQNVRIQLETGGQVTAYRDAGVQDLFEKDRSFRRATIAPAGIDEIGPQARARICKFFKDRLQVVLDPDDVKIADAIAHRFPVEAQRLRAVLSQLQRLPRGDSPPKELLKLGEVIEQCVRRCRETREVVVLAKKHLDALNEGFQLLNLYHAELTDQAVAAVNDAANVCRHEGAQLADLGPLDPEVGAAVDRIEEQLASRCPWREIAAIAPDVAQVRAAYRKARGQLLAEQERNAQIARGMVKGRDGYATLSADQSHRVLRPLTVVLTVTADDAIAPPLRDLRDPFLVALERAREEANRILDDILNARDVKPVERVELGLHNRELATEADVEVLVGEVRERLIARIRAGARVRIA